MGKILLHFARLIAVSILGLALLIFGIVWLIKGISDHKPLPILAGSLALAVVATAFLCAFALAAAGGYRKRHLAGIVAQRHPQMLALHH